MNASIPLITVLGPTAVGKTTFAAHLALAINGEILSADSRQVFKGMDIGTGKDLSDYCIDGQVIVSYLIDIAEPGTEYNVFRFQRDFDAAYKLIISKGKTPIMCGGTGLYVESVLLGYDLIDVPVNTTLRQELSVFSESELAKQLTDLRFVHNTTDTINRERILRAIEIEKYKLAHKSDIINTNFIETPVLGLRFNRSTIRERITSRLSQRLNEGMIEEVQHLLDSGISNDRLVMYGLEYKYVTLYLAGEMSYQQMFSLLNTSIHQFAKRQMTWFSRMEKKGIRILWLEGEDGLNVNINKALDYLKCFE